MNSQPTDQTCTRKALPLCVDLDGTLVRTDTLVECFIAAIRNWSILLSIPFWLFQGKAKLKANLAFHGKVDASLLPYNDSLLDYLHEQRRSGRRLVLATAANRNIAIEINRHLNIFDEIIASDESRNLRGTEKAKALVERFGIKGFCYIGNDGADIPVWKCASSGILVNVSGRVEKEAANLTLIERRFYDKPRLLQVLFKELRPHQWLKNLLVFVPIITSGAFLGFFAILNAYMMFIAFCCTASAIYIINDLYDLEADR